MSNIPITSSPSPPRNRWLLAVGAVLLAISPIATILIAHPIQDAGLPMWLTFVPWVALVVSFGWISRTRWWILAAALAPLPLMFPFLGLAMGLTDSSLGSWLALGLGLLVIAVFNALLAALGTWLGRR